MTYPSGRVIIYSYTNDRAVSVLNNAANLATNIGYKPFGGMASLTYGNGLSGSISYDNQYSISAISVGTSGSILKYTYADDANGNITSIANGLDATKNRSFAYDSLDRITSATSTGLWGSLSWTYDKVGNRLTEGTNAYAYISNTNKLSSANGLSYGFDTNGNTTAEGTRTYTYNQNQRLIQAVDGTMSAGYTYNGNGQRVKKTVNGTMTIYHYSLNGQIVAESDGSGSIAAEYVYLNGQPLAKIEGANTYYYHNDHLATPQKMTDSSGTVVWSADYKPFGEATVTISTITNNLRFPGQYFDAETGLYQNGFRDYNSTIGKYPESDPLLLTFFYKRTSFFLIPILATSPERIQPYSYVANNPVNRIDPLGLIHYNAPAPRTVPVQGQTLQALQCTEQCLQTATNNPNLNLLITGGAEPTGHSQNSHHYSGQACDIHQSNPVNTNQVMTCAAQCGFGAGQPETFPDNPNRNHWHLQLTPGNGVPALPEVRR
jgi:RHS repeat-associated protein